MKRGTSISMTTLPDDHWNQALWSKKLYKNKNNNNLTQTEIPECIKENKRD